MLFLAQPDPPKVLIIGIDGATWDVIARLRAQNKMPNLGRLIETGSWGVLRSGKKEVSPTIWTTIATGKPEAEHGIHGFRTDKEGGTGKRMVTSVDRKTSALWEILARNGMRPGFIGWWASWPAEEVGDGYIVTDHVTYSRTRMGVTGRSSYTTGGYNTYPDELADAIEPLVALPKDITVEEIRRFMDVSVEEATVVRDIRYQGDFIDFTNPLSEFKFTYQSDKSYVNIAQQMLKTHEVDVMGVYLQGIDVMEHSFWMQYDGRSGDPNQSKVKRVVPAYYEQTDRFIGRLLELVDESTTVIVLSDHGFGTFQNTQEMIRKGRTKWYGWHKPEGIFIINGPGIVGGGHSIGIVNPLDLTPTVLALLGLPLGEDMKGKVLRQALAPELRVSLKTKTIPTHDAGRTPRTDVPYSPIDANQERRLRGIGYLGGSGDEDEEDGGR